jgi:glycosyltransferase involved in cell wall biosynthesis
VDHGRIDVGVPIYRGGEHIIATLQSLVDQTYKNFSVLISVDGGDTESANICRPFLSDPRFRLVVQEQHLGWAGNTNWLISQSEGAFFCYYQQDDLTAPTYFEVLVAEAARHPDAAIVFSDVQFFGDDERSATGRSITGDVLSRLLKQLESFSHTPLYGLVRARGLREAAGGLRLTENESFGEDFVWVLKLARAGDLINVPEKLYFKRGHAASISRAWFENWPQAKRRRALITLCVGLLDAVLPAAQSNLQRFHLLYAVLERLALHQWFYHTKALSANERRDLVVDFITELRASAEIDVAQSFEINWDLLTTLSLRRFGLPEGAIQQATSQATRAIDDANQCLIARLGYRLGDDIDFSQPDSRRYMQGAWGDPEPWGVWTHGSFFELVLWLEQPTTRRLLMQVYLKPFLENVSRQRLAVSVNGAGLGFFPFRMADTKADRPRWCEVSIPFDPGTSPSYPLRISFELLDLPSPDSLGLPVGAPILGIGFLSARVVYERARRFYDFRRTLLLDEYPDIAEAGAGPLEHYLANGRLEKRKPCARFDPAAYSEVNPDVTLRADWKGSGGAVMRAETIFPRPELTRKIASGTKRLIIILTPGWDVRAGGVLSIAAIFKETEALTELHGAKVALCAVPGDDPLFLKYSWFENSNYLLDIKAVLRSCENLDYLQLHIPEYAVNVVSEWLTATSSTLLRNVREIHLNIMLQNIDLIEGQNIGALKRFGTVTATTAHDAYSTIATREALGIAVHKLSVCCGPELYKRTSYRNKKPILVVSHDGHPRKDEVLRRIARAHPQLQISIVNNLSYEEYKTLISRAKWALTFGEGLDGYFGETIFSGGNSFAVFNERFFTPPFAALETVYPSWEVLLERMPIDLQRLDEPIAYDRCWREAYELLTSLYGTNRFRENLRAFYRGKYTFP